MWKVLWPLALLAMVFAENATDLSPKLPPVAPLVSNASSVVNMNESAKATDTKKEATTKIPTDVKFDDKADVGSMENPIDPVKLAVEEETLGNFKYYFFLLLVSSLSVISIIVYKTFRLRRSRAEVKYGKASVNDRSETQPLGKQQWLEESSDENEDEIFDINFLKNKRSQII